MSKPFATGVVDAEPIKKVSWSIWKSGVAPDSCQKEILEISLALMVDEARSKTPILVRVSEPLDCASRNFTSGIIVPPPASNTCGKKASIGGASWVMAARDTPEKLKTIKKSAKKN